MDLREKKGRESGEDCIMRSFITFMVHLIYYSGEQTKEGEMSRVCGTHGRDEKCIQYFGQKT